MTRIVPHPLAADKLAQATARCASSNSAHPYFAMEGTVKIGGYSGHLRYLTCGGDAAPDSVPSALFGAPHAVRQQAGALDPSCRIKAVAVIEAQRGPLRKVIDRVFHGIGFDGVAKVPARELAAFLHLEESIAVQGDPATRETTGGVVGLKEEFALHADHKAALETLSESLFAVDVDWSHIERLLAIPAVSRAVWGNDLLLRMVIGACPHAAGLYRLAETYRPADGGPWRGLQVMLDDPDLMEEFVIPLLGRSIESLRFSDAIRVLTPFQGLMGKNGGRLFYSGPREAKSDAEARLWTQLLSMAGTLDHLVRLSGFCREESYHAFMETLLSDMLESSRGRALPQMAVVGHILSEALRYADEYGDKMSKDAEPVRAVRKLVEETLPDFLGGPKADDGTRVPLTWPCIRFKTVFNIDILQSLVQIRRRLDKLIDFKPLVGCLIKMPSRVAA